MNLSETTRICRAIASMKPAQHFDAETPAFWQAVLADIRYEDARTAVIQLAGTTRFIGVDEIKAEVKRIRRQRLQGIDRLSHLAETPTEWRELIRRVADGDLEVPPLAIDGEQDPRLTTALPHVFKRVPALEAGA